MVGFHVDDYRAQLLHVRSAERHAVVTGCVLRFSERARWVPAGDRVPRDGVLTGGQAVDPLVSKSVVVVAGSRQSPGSVQGIGCGVDYDGGFLRRRFRCGPVISTRSLLRVSTVRLPSYK